LPRGDWFVTWRTKKTIWSPKLLMYKCITFMYKSNTWSIKNKLMTNSCHHRVPRKFFFHKCSNRLKTVFFHSGQYILHIYLRTLLDIWKIEYHA
jgi:hypothetical protein